MQTLLRNIPPFEVEVTQADIDNGTPNDPCKCPIALAVKREFPDLGVSVGSRTVCLESGVAAVAFYHQAHDFINEFDRGGKVQPRTVRFTR